MTATDTITAAQFEAVARLMYGEEWRAKAAALLGVSLRNVQFWTAEPPARFKPVPRGVAAELIIELRRRLTDPETAAGMASRAARMAAQADFVTQVIARETAWNESAG
jgi:hypothetical protein